MHAEETSRDLSSHRIGKQSYYHQILTLIAYPSPLESGNLPQPPNFINMQRENIISHDEVLDLYFLQHSPAPETMANLDILSAASSTFPWPAI
jgi:hypothetical protein